MHLSEASYRLERSSDGVPGHPCITGTGTLRRLRPVYGIGRILLHDQSLPCEMEGAWCPGSLRIRFSFCILFKSYGYSAWVWWSYPANRLVSGSYMACGGSAGAAVAHLRNGFERPMGLARV